MEMPVVHTTESTRETPAEAVCKRVHKIAFASDSSYTCVKYADRKHIVYVGSLGFPLTLDQRMRHNR